MIVSDYFTFELFHFNVAQLNMRTRLLGTQYTYVVECVHAGTVVCMQSKVVQHRNL